jgi:GNAT superfamily N-acetyltransferase
MGFQLDNPNTAAQNIKKLATSLTQWTFNDITVRVRTSPFLIELLWKDQGRNVAGFTLMEQPNCCGVLISTKTFVEKAYQKQGIAQGMMPLKEALAREYGYSCLVATVNVTGNPAEVHILNKNAWVQGASFVNKRTKNTVAFFTKVLQ